MHPSVIVEGDVVIGKGTTIGPGSVLVGPLVIGENNRIGPQVMIGVDPEHKSKAPAGKVIIGNGNTIREFSVIQRGIGDRDTTVQDNCYIMTSSYIAHDCYIESDVILCAKVGLSGHCHVLKGAIMGLASVAHQFSTIGSHAFVGMGSVVVKDVPPFCVVMGNPISFARLNMDAIDKLGLQLKDLQVEGAKLHSDQPYICKCLTEYAQHSRRKSLFVEISTDSF